MAECGTLNADGTVRVELSWYAGTPDPVQEYAHLDDHAGDIRDIPTNVTPVAGAKQSVRISDLRPGANYEWLVWTQYSDLTSWLTSDSQWFTTPSAPLVRVPATNLSCSSY